jgi:hypothetical protein
MLYRLDQNPDRPDPGPARTPKQNHDSDFVDHGVGVCDEQHPRQPMDVLARDLASNSPFKAVQP